LLRLAFAVLAVTLGSTPALADASNRARALVDECKNDKASCEEYLLGVFDAVLVYGEMVHAPLVCPQAAPTGGDLLAAFEKWVAENPDKLDNSRGVGAMLAVKHAFPCPQNPTN
jgi:hypothetical protein